MTLKEFIEKANEVHGEGKYDYSEVIYEGNNQIIHASNSSPPPKGGVKESPLYFTGGRCLRPKAFIAQKNNLATI